MTKFKVKLLTTLKGKELHIQGSEYFGTLNDLPFDIAQAVEAGKKYLNVTEIQPEEVTGVAEIEVRHTPDAFPTSTSDKNLASSKDADEKKEPAVRKTTPKKKPAVKKQPKKPVATGTKKKRPVLKPKG